MIKDLINPVLSDKYQYNVELGTRLSFQLFKFILINKACCSFYFCGNAKYSNNQKIEEKEPTFGVKSNSMAFVKHN